MKYPPAKLRAQAGKMRSDVKYGHVNSMNTGDVMIALAMLLEWVALQEEEKEEQRARSKSR